MVNKIDSGGFQPRRADAAPVKTNETGSRNQAAPTDSVANGSPESQELARSSTYERLKQQVSDSSEIDAQKVADIKAALQRGEFSIDANRVAKAVVELEQLLVR